MSVPRRAAANRWILIALFSYAFVSIGIENADAHGGIFRGPTGRNQRKPLPPASTGTTASGLQPANQASARALPGSGPQIAYSEERWEFWWEYNHDPFVDLRAVLRSQPGAQGANDDPFRPPTADQKRQTLIPFLVNMLRDRDDQVRSAAVFSLARMGYDSVIPYIEHIATADSSLGTSTNAIIALGIARSPKAIATLDDILRTSSAQTEMRSYAAISLGLIGTPECSEILRKYLAFRRFANLKYQLRLSMAYAIGLTADPDNAPLVRELVLSESDDYMVQSLLIQSLGKLGDRAANPILVDACRSKITQIRRSAVIALGTVAGTADRDVIDALKRVARHDSDHQTKNFAYISLGRIAEGGDAGVERFLLDELSRATHNHRSFVCLALGLTGNGQLANKLQRAFVADKELSLRSSIGLSLGLLGDTSSLPMLEKTFDDVIEPVHRGYLALSLGMLGSQKAIPEMRKIVKKETDVELMLRTIMGLGLVGDRKTIDILHKRFDSDPDQLTRASIVYGLGQIGDIKSMPKLMEIARKSSETDLVRAFAVLALGYIGANADLPVQSRISTDVNYTLEATFITELWNLL